MNSYHRRSPVCSFKGRGPPSARRPAAGSPPLPMPAKRSGASRGSAAPGASASSASAISAPQIHLHITVPCSEYTAFEAPIGASPAASPDPAPVPASSPQGGASSAARPPARGWSPQRPVTGPPTRAPVSAGAARGLLPPAASSSGKRYYALLPQHGGPAVVAGHEFAVQELGGSWFAHGRAPSGFASLEDAINHLVAVLPDAYRSSDGAWAIPVRFR